MSSFFTLKFLRQVILFPLPWGKEFMKHVAQSSKRLAEGKYTHPPPSLPPGPPLPNHFSSCPTAQIKYKSSWKRKPLLVFFKLSAAKGDGCPRFTGHLSAVEFGEQSCYVKPGKWVAFCSPIPDFPFFNQIFEGFLCPNLDIPSSSFIIFAKKFAPEISGCFLLKQLIPVSQG